MDGRLLLVALLAAGVSAFPEHGLKTKLEPQPDAEPQPYAEPEPEPTPVPGAEPQTYATPEPETTPEPTPVARGEPQIYAEPEPEPTPEPTPRSEPAPGPDSSASSQRLESSSEEHRQPDAAYGGRSVAGPVSGTSSEVVIGVPTNAKECVQAGGECIPTDECPNAEFGWNQPFKGICGKEGYDCCFKEIRNHSMECGVFGGDCTRAENCGAAPRHQNARCPRAGEVCCIWLF